MRTQTKPSDKAARPVNSLKYRLVSPQPPFLFVWPKHRGINPQRFMGSPAPVPSLDRKALTAAALAYLDGRLSIIPVNSRKKPAIPEWTPFQEKQATREQVKGWGRKDFVVGFAAVCGEVSGGLTIIDFDVPGFYERWAALAGELAQTLPTQQTGGGGAQVAFRSGLVVANDKLAWSPVNNKMGREIAIETRGEGGYAVLPPSFCNLAEKRGVKHKQPYRAIQGNFAKIPTIPDEQARHLLEVARSLCHAPKTKTEMQTAPLSPRGNGGQAGGGVIGRFNEVYGVEVILSRNSYQPRGNRYLAPDSTTGEPGVYIFGDTGRCYSHHGNDPLNDGHAHNPFSVFCILEHGGDVGAAVRAAAAELGIERTPGNAPGTENSRSGGPEENKVITLPDRHGQALPVQSRSYGKEQSPAIRFVSGAELEALDFPEPVWIIPGFLGEGYILLAGRPKLGKSWLGLSLGVAVSTGGCALGKAELRAVHGEVLYLALEDRLRRIQGRLKQILCGSPFPKNLLIAESWERLDRGGLDNLRLFLKEHDDCRLVVIDTLAKVRPPRQKNIDPYEHDAAVGGALQALAHQYRVSILVVHHTRKSEANDPLDEVSGTTGITGAADSILILKRGRGKVDGTLSITGRDVEEQELALKFHPAEGLWELMGEAAECAMSQERQDILLILRNVGPKTLPQLVSLIGKSRDAMRMNLIRMRNAGIVRLNERNEYEVI